VLVFPAGQIARRSSTQTSKSSMLKRPSFLRRRLGRPDQFPALGLGLRAALDLEAGEAVQWQLLQRTDLRLRRLEAKRPSADQNNR
jgi:hypothetical protein